MYVVSAFPAASALMPFIEIAYASRAAERASWHADDRAAIEAAELLVVSTEAAREAARKRLPWSGCDTRTEVGATFYAADLAARAASEYAGKLREAATTRVGGRWESRRYGDFFENRYLLPGEVWPA